MALANYGTGLDKIQLRDPNGKKLSIREFVEAYEKTDRLVLYFSKPDFTSYHSEVFGTMTHFDYNGKKDVKNYRTWPPVPYVLYFCNESAKSDQSKTQNDDIPFSCSHCNFKTETQQEFDKHTVMKHPGKAGYQNPNPNIRKEEEDIEGLTTLQCR